MTDQDKLDSALRVIVAFINNEGYWPTAVSDEDQLIVESAARERDIGKMVIYI